MWYGLQPLSDYEESDYPTWDSPQNSNVFVHLIYFIIVRLCMSKKSSLKKERSHCEHKTKTTKHV